MKLALCQMDITYEDKQSNAIQAEAFIKEAANYQADVILFPEMSLTGFSMNIDRTKEWHEETLHLMTELAKKYQLAIGIGWVKAVGEKAENHYTIIDKIGNILSDYAKIHPFSYSGENKYFNPGTHTVSFTLNDVPCSNFICYDLRFPEIFQIVSRQSHVIFIPANWPKARREHWMILLKARAIENQVYVVAVNCVGKQEDLEYSGDSCVVNPNGEVEQTAGDEEKLLIYDLIDDVKQYRQRFPTKKDRQDKRYASWLEC